MTDLNLEELVSLETDLAAWCPLRKREGVTAAIAMARELVRTRSLLAFLACHEDLFDLWEQDDGFHAAEPHRQAITPGHATPMAALAAHAAGLGFVDPTTTKAEG